MASKTCRTSRLNSGAVRGGEGITPIITPHLMASFCSVVFPMFYRRNFAYYLLTFSRYIVQVVYEATDSASQPEM